jgi:hypothetical protein
VLIEGILRKPRATASLIALRFFKQAGSCAEVSESPYIIKSEGKLI